MPVSAREAPDISPPAVMDAALWQASKARETPEDRADRMFGLECGERALLASSGFAGRQP